MGQSLCSVVQFGVISCEIGIHFIFISILKIYLFLFTKNRKKGEVREGLRDVLI
jgi:hypothetical protein